MESTSGTFTRTNDKLPYNGFDVGSALVPTDQLVLGGPVKGGIPALCEPKVRPASEPDRFLNDDSLVIGVELSGEARAYPINIVQKHEAVNDVLADVPILVSYQALCNSTVVFKRPVLGNEPTVFGISGLMWNSNVVFYDKQIDDQNKTESLWSQIEMRAISGPAAGRKLEVLAASVMSQAEWLKQQPQSSFLSSDTGYRYNYNPQFDPFKAYRNSQELMFPVQVKLGTPQRFSTKEKLVVLKTDNHIRAYAFKDIADYQQQSGEGLFSR